MPTLQKTRRPRREGLTNPFRMPSHERLRREQRDVFREQRNAILSYLGAEQKSYALSHKDDQEGDAGYGAFPWHFPTWDQFRLGALAVSKRMTPILSATWDWSLSKFAPMVGLDADEWSVTNPFTVHAIGRQAFDFCQSTNESTSKSLDAALNLLREELADGIIDQGEALPALTKRINQIFDKAEKHKARQIAQTETARAVHAAQEQAAKASSVVTGWRWLASADACQEICLAIVARSPTVALGQPFAVVGHNPTYMHIMHPPAHPNCNCSMVPVLTSDPQPQWHDTLVQPQKATDEEIDVIGEDQRRQWEDIARTWDPVTHEYGAARTPQPATIVPPKPAIQKFGESAATVDVVAGEDKQVIERKVQSLLGPGTTLQDVASVAGATDDAKVTVIAESQDDYAIVAVESKDYGANRSFGIDEDGTRWLGANAFYVSKEMQGKGIVGPQVFGRMVENAVRLGFGRIETDASRASGDNGYYTWARFGYDADIPDQELPTRPRSLAWAKRISDLMSTEEGQAWWKEHGVSTQMTFDLSPGSLSRRIWESYLAMKRSVAKANKRISRKTIWPRSIKCGRRLVI